MEEMWLLKRQELQALLREDNQRPYRELAAETGYSLGWVKKWVPRLRQDLSDDSLLHRRTSPRAYERPSRSPQVIEVILDIRDHPPDNLRRTPGPKAILYYLQNNEELKTAGVPIPRSTRTIWMVLDAYQRIHRPTKPPREPLPLAPPMLHWQFDFKDVTTAQQIDSEKRAHQVETLNIVDTGTSMVLDNHVRSDFNAETAILSLASTFLRQGLPHSLTFDRDPRFVGSQQNRAFPSALLRFLHCLGVKPQVCPPRRPDKNAYVERFHLALETEAIQVDRPVDVPQTRQCVDTYRDHYNLERPNQARSCGNRPPIQAFPQLPRLTPLPPHIDPDAWLDAIHGKLYKRRVGHNGSVKVDKHRYYIKQALRGQLIVLKVNAPQRCLDVFHHRHLIKQLPIRGLYDEVLPLQDYLRLICQEAVSEERKRLGRKQYWSTI